jgi:hypothetical protein
MEECMRKLSSIAGAALLAMTAFATPAPASAAGMMAGGSCGYSAGDYGFTDVNSSKANTEGETVPALFYTVNYSGVPAPTTVGVIVRYNGELESQTAVQAVTAEHDGGSFDGALRSSIAPEAQGFANSINGARRGSADGSGSGSRTQGSGTQGGLTPGEYVFYVYTGSRGDVYNVKDGTVSRNAFIADEAGYLGMFSCGVSTEQGSGPG